MKTRPPLSAANCQLSYFLAAVTACAMPLCEAATVSIANGPQGTFAVSGTDLGQAAGTTLVLTSGSAPFGSSVGRLNDGDIYGGEGIVGTTYTLTPSASGTATFNFDLGLSPQGYDLSMITVLTASGQSRSGQSYGVSYAEVDTPTTYVPLAFLTGSETNNIDNMDEVQSILTSLGAFNVASVRFTFANVGDESMYREIDISGAASAVSAVPEPGSMVALGGLLAGGLLIRQRKARKS